MNEEQEFPSGLLIKNTISAFKGGYLEEERVMFVLDFAAKLGDAYAQELLDRCKETGALEVFSSIGE